MRSGGVGTAKDLEVIEVVKELKKGDVVALYNDLNGNMGQTLVFVDRVEGDTVIGAYNGFFDGDDRMVRNYSVGYISKLEIVARAGSFAAKVLSDQAAENWLNFRRLQRIDQRVSKKQAELRGLVE